MGRGVLFSFMLARLLVSSAAVAFERPFSSWLLGPRAFATEPAVAVRAALTRAVVGQGAAVEGIVAAVEEWHAASLSTAPYPLVLVLVGSKGVGKTESAQAIAPALLGVKGIAPLHRCLVLLQGSNMRTADDVVVPIVQALYECGGNIVTLFDELQKASDAALSALQPMLMRSAARFTHPDMPRGLSAAHAAFIIVSDVGDKVLLNLGEAGRKGSLDLVDKRMRVALAKEFARGSLELNTRAPNIIVYHPFRGTGVAALLRYATARVAATVPALMDDAAMEPALSFLLARVSVSYGDEDPDLGDSCSEDLEAAALLPCNDRNSAEWHVGADGGATHSEDETAAVCVCGFNVAVPPTCILPEGGRPIIEHNDKPVRAMTRLLQRALAGKFPAPQELRTWAYHPTIQARIRVTCPSQRASSIKQLAGAVRVVIERCEIPPTGTGHHNCTVVHKGAPGVLPGGIILY